MKSMTQAVLSEIDVEEQSVAAEESRIQRSLYDAREAEEQEASDAYWRKWDSIEGLESLGFKVVSQKASDAYYDEEHDMEWLGFKQSEWEYQTEEEHNKHCQEVQQADEAHYLGWVTGLS